MYMNNHCKMIRQQVDQDMKKPSQRDKAIESVKHHISACSSCRNYIYEKKLSLLLHLHHCRTSPEPSACFFEKLSRKVAETEKKEPVFADILTWLGIRLAPAMAGLLLMLSGSSAYFYHKFTETEHSYDIVDVVLFSDTQTFSDIIIDTKGEEF